jgi:uncharacterized protein YgbK (DUF1537 family)
LPERGIVIGEAERAADLAVWGALGAQRGVLAAGASEFFGAYLEALGHPPLERPAGGQTGDERDLHVCGSTSAGSRAFCRHCEERGIPVFGLPDGLLRPPGTALNADALVARWAEKVVGALEASSRVIVAIDRPLCVEPGMPRVLGGYLSAAVEQVLGLTDVDRVFATGGATAAALVRRMGWTRLRVRREWSTGVVALEVKGHDAPLVSMKPGSYDWPEAALI